MESPLPGGKPKPGPQGQDSLLIQSINFLKIGPEISHPATGAGKVDEEGLHLLPIVPIGHFSFLMPQ